MSRDPRYDSLFEPVEIGPLTARNRFVQVPHCNGMGSTFPTSMATMRGMKRRAAGLSRIVGALANLGHRLSDETVGNILRRHGIAPAPKRKHTTTWKEFIRSHMDILAGTDFFAVEVFTLRGFVTYYVLFFIHLESRRVEVAGITPHPNEAWMKQIARNVTMDEWGFLENCRYFLHDRDTKFCESFCGIIESGDVKPVALPAELITRTFCTKAVEYSTAPR